MIWFGCKPLVKLLTIASVTKTFCSYFRLTIGKWKTSARKDGYNLCMEYCTYFSVCITDFLLNFSGSE